MLLHFKMSVKLPLFCMVSLRAFSPDLWLNMIELLVYDAETNWFWNWRETVRRLAVGISTEWVELSTSGSIDWVWLWLFLVIIFLWLRPFYYFTQLLVERCLITARLRPLALDGTVLGSFNCWKKHQFRNLFNLVQKIEGTTTFLQVFHQLIHTNWSQSFLTIGLVWYFETS